jgi:hypothetical protein
MVPTVAVVVAAIGLAACAAPPREVPGSPTERSTATTTPAEGAIVAMPAPLSLAPSPPPAPDTTSVRASACAAPSLAIHGPADARDGAALATCRFAPPPGVDVGSSCGTPGRGSPPSLDRLDQAVLPLDDVTSRRMREIAARGAALGRRPGVFALVGDSMTDTHWFLSPFSSPSRTLVPDEVRARLQLPGGGDVLTFHRERPADAGLDSFLAPRAAKVGARSSFALPDGAGGSAPLLALVDRLSPEIAIVLFGSNDATVRFTEVPSLVDTFRARMGRIVDALEERGVVPLLSTIPRHGREPGRPDCDRSAADLSNWRIAVQVSALSAAVAELACERQLPLVDLRHALDAIPNAGLGPDGVHPIAARSGAGDLRPAALECGMNVRNYVTLRALRELRVVLDAPSGGPPPAPPAR